MRDISELDAIMEALQVPRDVRHYIANARVSKALYYWWIFVFIGMMLGGVGLGFWFLTQFLIPFETMNTCTDEDHIAPIIAMLSAMIGGIPLAGILMTYLVLLLSERHSISLFAVGFLNENNDPYSDFFVRRLNRDRPLGDTPHAYVRRATIIWLPYAWVAVVITIGLTSIGLVWTNAVC